MSESNGSSPEFPLVPQYVEPASVTEIWATNGVPTVSGGEVVRVEVHSVAGRFVHFMDPATAVTIGKQISDQGHKSAAARHVIGPDGRVLG